MKIVKWWSSSFIVSFFLFIFLFFSTLNFGLCAGYEKTVGWGARYSALGGAAVAAVDGAEGLFYNPAGISRGHKLEASLNVSPYLGEFRAPLIKSYQENNSNQDTVIMGAILASYTHPSGFALAAGYYSVGGNNIRFGPVDFGIINSNYNSLRPPMNSSLKITEFSLGASYLWKDWSFGLSWRANFFEAEFETPTLTSTAVIDPHLTGMKDKEVNGFRLGTQYRPKDKNFGLGLAFRSSVDFTLKGRSFGYGESILGGDYFHLTGGGDVSVKNTFPWQINTGGFYQFKKFVVHGEYSYSHYAVNKSFEVSGTPLLAGTTNVLVSSNQNWKNQHALKLGVEIPWKYFWMFRAGTSFTTQVVPNDFARATSSSPALGHSYVIGLGQKRKNWSWDSAIDYSYAKGIDKTTESKIRGEFSSRAIGLNLSGKIFF